VPLPANPPPLERQPEAGNFRKLEKAVAVLSTLVVVARVVSTLSSSSVGTGATTTLASSITPATTTFIIINALPADWVNRKIDDNGALRAAAWADGGVNDSVVVAPEPLDS
jgi:hypothetical protein